MCELVNKIAVLLEAVYITAAGNGMELYFLVCALVIGLAIGGAILGFIGLAGPVFGWGGTLAHIGVTMTMLSPIIWVVYLMTVVITSFAQ